MINRTKDFEEIEHSLHNKKIVYIATKNHDYIRIEQEIGILKKYDNGCITLVSKNKNYFIRILEIFLRVLILDFRKIDIVYISFLPQFIIPFLFWKFGKAQIWTDFFISLYDTLVFDRKKISEHSFLSKLLKWVDEITIQKSNVIICDTKVHGKYFIDVLGANPESMHVLYLKANENIYYPRDIMSGSQYECGILNRLKHLYKRVQYCYGAVTRKQIVKLGINFGGINLIHSNRLDIGCYIANRFKVPHIWHLREMNAGYKRMVYYKKTVWVI